MVGCGVVIVNKMNFAYLFKWIEWQVGVGKSSIVMQFLHEEFRPDCETTIGVEFASKTLLLDQLPIKLQIWDTVLLPNPGRPGGLPVHHEILLQGHHCCSPCL